MRFRTLVLPIALLALSAGPVRALRFYVNSDPNKGDDRRSVQSAQDSATAFRTVTHALRIANLIREGRPHVIVVPTGTYSPSRGETFPLVISQKDIYLEIGANVVFDAEGKSNFFQITAPTQDFLINNITFINGRADLGGVAYCQSCSLRVADCSFIDNRATQGGHLLYVDSGRLKFFNNLVRTNGTSGSSAAILELRGPRGDTTLTQIRNNTFYRNPSVNVLTTGTRTDISNNIFVGPEQPAILDADTATITNPLVRYNLFWETPILYLSDRQDSIKVLRTVRDTLTLAEQGIQVPSFVTNQPDTVAKAGERYHYRIEVSRDRSLYRFNPATLPAGASSSDVSLLGEVNWTPALSDTNQRREVRIEINDDRGLNYLTYNIRVYSAASFPDTTHKGPTITITLVPDTTGAVAALNRLVPVFSTAASAGNNLYKNPKFLSPDFGRFEPDPTSPASPAIDAGNPIAALQDRASTTLPRNDIGHTGGPGNSGPPGPGTFSELKITSLPDSVAVEGQVYTYNPTIDRQALIDLVDVLPGVQLPPSMSRAFGDRPPIRWTPTLADTGSYLVGLLVYTNDSKGRQYFSLRVKPANDPPRVLSTAPAVAYEDSLYSYTVSASDPNGDPVSFTLTQAPQGMSITAQGVLRWTPTQAQVGSAQVQIRVADDKGAATSQSFTLVVRHTNHPPQITSQPDTTVLEDHLYQYAVQATDPDPGDSLAYALTQAPQGMSITAQGVLRWTPTQLDIGRLLIGLQVSDRSGAKATQTFALTVVPVNDPPQITSQPDTTVLEDHLYRYVIQAVDEEGDPLRYSLLTGPARMAIDSTRVLRWTPTQADTGRHAVSLQVADPGGQTAGQSFVLRVIEVNDPPVISSHVPADSVLLVSAPAPLSFAIQATDEEGDSLRYAWRVNGARQAGAQGDHFTYTPSTTVLDTVRALVWDAADTASFSWVVDSRQLPRIRVAADTVAFGEVALGDTGRARLVVANVGRGDLLIDSLRVNNLDFSAVFGKSRIPPADSTFLELHFLPSSRGPRHSSIGFATNDPNHLSVQIPLAGTGVVGTRLQLDLDPAAGAQGRLDTTLAAAQPLTLDVYASGAVGLLGYELLFAYEPSYLGAPSFALDRPEAGLLAPNHPQPALSAPAADRLLVKVDSQAGAQGISGSGLLGRLSLVADSSFVVPRHTSVHLLQVVLRSAATADTLHPILQVQVQARASLAGDFNGDRVVDFADFFLFADHFGTRSSSPGWDPAFDLSPNGAVDFADFFAFADSFGRRN